MLQSVCVRSHSLTINLIFFMFAVKLADEYAQYQQQAPRKKNEKTSRAFKPLIVMIYIVCCSLRLLLFLLVDLYD